MLDHCRRGLTVAAAAYLALLPSNAISFWRSLAFAVAALCAAGLLVANREGRRASLPSPGPSIVIAALAWLAWCSLSLQWSIDPAFTLRELKSDLAWGAITALLFYVATLQGAGRLLLGTALAAAAFWPALALGLALSPAGWNARLAHMGVVAYSTYVATVAPLLLLLVWRPPLGWNEGWRAPAVAMLLLGLLVVTARLSENRIVWGALGASVIVLVLATRGAERRRAALAAVLAAVAFGALLVDAMQDRALKVYPPNTTVEDTLERDPRLAIWRHAGEHLAQRPLTGHGYGRLILQEELRADTGDHLLTHAHNMFVSHALQTGAIGLALLLVLLVTLLARYANLLRTHDATLRRVGTLGLAVIAAFVVKNLTDDFFFRANQKVLFALNAVLLGMAVLRERELRRQD